MRVAFFGGSFDPPHLAHTLACLWALETGEVDRVLMVPVARHAFGKPARASFDHRLEMCRLATRHLDQFVEVSDIEGRREGTTYTIDTIRALLRDHPDWQFRLLIGTDIVADLPKWREGSELLRLAPPLEVPRPEGGRPRPGALPDISSTAVRAALATGAETRMLLSEAVAHYIQEHTLYR